jgi:group I intron endonuclease
MKGIYLIKNTKTNKVYIGSSIKLSARKQRHFKNLADGNHHSNKLQNSYNKYGIDSFIFEYIEQYDDIDNDVLVQKEQYWIDYYDSYHNGYNCRPKAENNYGHRHSNKTKKLLSKLNSGENNAMYGKKLTEEHKQMLREKSSGRKDSLETIEKKRLAGLNRTHSEETKLKQSRIKKSKPIYQLDKNFNIVKEWYSKREVSRVLGINITHSLKNKNKYSRGFYWLYVSDYKCFIEGVSG